MRSCHHTHPICIPSQESGQPRLLYQRYLRIRFPSHGQVFLKSITFILLYLVIVFLHYFLPIFSALTNSRIRCFSIPLVVTLALRINMVRNLVDERKIDGPSTRHWSSSDLRPSRTLLPRQFARRMDWSIDCLKIMKFLPRRCHT